MPSGQNLIKSFERATVIFRRLTKMLFQASWATTASEERDPASFRSGWMPEQQAPTWPWQRPPGDLDKGSQGTLTKAPTWPSLIQPTVLTKSRRWGNSWGIALALMRNREIRIALNQSSFEVTEKSARFHTDWACIERIRDFRRCKASRDAKCSPENPSSLNEFGS